MIPSWLKHQNTRYNRLYTTMLRVFCWLNSTPGTEDDTFGLTPHSKISSESFSFTLSAFQFREDHVKSHLVPMKQALESALTESLSEWRNIKQSTSLRNVYKDEWCFRKEALRVYIRAAGKWLEALFQGGIFFPTAAPNQCDSQTVASVCQTCQDIPPHRPAKPTHPSLPPPQLSFPRSSPRGKRQTVMEEDTDQSDSSISILLFPFLCGCTNTLAGLWWFLLTCSCICVCMWVYKSAYAHAHAHQAAKFSGKCFEWITSRSAAPGNKLEISTERN